jgi:3-hydroxyacyl-[acyl-carrier-protein] dehydratase
MLKDHFYRITGKEIINEYSFKVQIFFDCDSPIFSGHFPGLPVVPGVCMMAIVKELLQEHINHSLVLLNSANMKFLSMINPLINKEVEVAVKYSQNTEGNFIADSTISFGETIFFKLTKAIYK